MKPDTAIRRPLQPLGDVSQHFWLVKRMARVSGADLVSALHDCDITTAEWAAMVMRCRGCDCVEGCKSWLSQAELSGADQPAPDGCRNRETLNQLRTMQEAQR